MMMWWWNDGMTWWGWFAKTNGMVIFWGLVVWGIVNLITSLTSQKAGELGHDRPRSSPEDVLRERFARGEIDADEYRTRLDVLKPPVPPGGRSDAA